MVMKLGDFKNDFCGVKVTTIVMTLHDVKLIFW